MSAEIKVTAAIEVSNSNYKFPKDGGTQLSITQTSPGGGVPGLMLATNAAQGVAVTSVGVTTPGWCRMENLDGTASVDWGPDDGGGNIVIVGTMQPGESALFRMKSTATIRLKSSVASSKVKVTIFEN